MEKRYCVALLLLFVLVIVSLSCVNGFEQDGLFHLYTIPNAQERRALCNDGSAYGFYFRKGSTNNWVFRLQGGGWCWDVPSCKSRYEQSRYWMTSKDLLPTMTDSDCIGPACHAGILSSNPTLNPYFHDSNHVYIWYCTSDSHLGNQTASTTTGGWSFLGKNVIQSVVEEVSTNPSFNFRDALRVLITGDSAGGVGTLNNIQWMTSMLRRHTTSKTIYKGFIDAGWFLDIPTFENRNTAFQNISKGLLKIANVEYDSNCVEHYKHSNQTWRCFHAQYVHSFIHLDLFWNEFSYDSANLGFDGLPGPPYSGKMLEFVNHFRRELVRTQQDVKNLFQANCFEHETEDTSTFFRVTVQRVRLANAVGRWFFQDQTMRLVDSCEPIDCNPTCFGHKD
eukprot:TRINITY_DN4548_c0_g1_i1.p1 TRINITY_DN4548_c0_g1~~TRINITY_DN4548_c0_g1_i1.p1  ORF type:complete len:393 (+),score=41.73 TRINITY_DN4548_c0_g1_i1:13-1191(+)